VDLAVALTPAALARDDLADRAVVVIDVLRAGTTIVTALANGARAVIPVAEEGEAGRYRATFDRDVSFIGGERDGKPLAGYDAGNSPAEYTEAAVAGRTVVLTTTNGTAALVHARGARRVAAGAFVNASALAGFLRQALDDGLGAVILCSGWRGAVSLEDTLCAGLLVDLVAGGASGLGDGAQIAYGLYRGAKSDLARALVAAEHTRRLVALGAADDVARCAQIDTTDTLPVFRDNQLVAAG